MSREGEILRKLDWAKEGLKTLDAACKKFIRSEPYRLVSNPNSDATEYVYSVENVKPVPLEIDLLVGDIIHNTRTTLDHLAFALSRRPSDKTNFPIWDTPLRNKKGRIIQPSFRGREPVAIKRVLKSVQPYIGTFPPHRWLSMLRDLDNTDKHRFIQPGIAALNGTAHGVYGETGEYQVDYEWGPLIDGEPVAYFRFAMPNPHVKINLHLMPDVTLQTVRPPWGDESIVSVLWTLTGAVQTTVREFRAFL